MGFRRKKNTFGSLIKLGKVSKSKHLCQLSPKKTIELHWYTILSLFNIGADLIHTQVIIDARKILMTSTSCKEHNGEFDPRLKSPDFIHRKIFSNKFSFLKACCRFSVYSRVHISLDSLFSKILKKPSILQK